MASRLSRFLEGSIFPIADIPPDMVKQLLSSQNLEIWKAAFTHESVNRNRGKNYDQFEKLGDSVLKTSYINFLLQKYPNISSSELNELVSHYLSKEVLGELSFKLNLPEYLDIEIGKSLSSSEDLFESLIGALFWIGNKIKYGAGFILADQFIFGVYSDIPLDMAVTRGPAKTQLKEIFESMHWGKPIETWTQKNISLPGKFIIRFTPEAMEFFKTQGGLPNNLLAMAEGASKKIASKQANQEAIERLNKMGLTFEWAETYKRRLEMNSPELSPYIPQLEEKAVSEGFINVYFKNVEITNKEKTIQLIGELEGGEKKVLVQITAPPDKSNINIHRELIQKYIS